MFKALQNDEKKTNRQIFGSAQCVRFERGRTKNVSCYMLDIPFRQGGFWRPFKGSIENVPKNTYEKNVHHESQLGNTYKSLVIITHLLQYHNSSDP